MDDATAEVLRQQQYVETLDWLDEEAGTDPGWLLPDLTTQVGYLYPGSTYIVSGRPGAGKTTFMEEHVVHWAEAGFSVIVFSLEGSQIHWRLRWACRATGLDWNDVQERAWHRLPVNAKPDLNKHLRFQRDGEVGQRLEIFDFERLDVEGLLNWIAQAGEMQVDLLVVDHVQEMDYKASAGNKTQAMEAAVREIKAATQAAGVRTVLVSQLGRPERDPVAEYLPAPLGSLQGTSALEQVAVAVLMIHRGLKTDLVEGDLVSVRRGGKSVDSVVDPGSMVVNILKNRQKGHVGGQIRAFVHQHRLYTDRDSFQAAVFHTEQAVERAALEAM